MQGPYTHAVSSHSRLQSSLPLAFAREQAREWKEGECIVFDDSWEHEVWHKGDVDRVVLLINFWHPELPPDERKIELNTFGYDPI